MGEGKNKVRSLILMQANSAVLSIPELSSLRGQNSPMVLESRTIERGCDVCAGSHAGRDLGGGCRGSANPFLR